MKDARLFNTLDIETIRQVSMHLNYEKYRKKAKQKVMLDENKYYFINKGQCLLSATNQLNNNYETIVDDTMVITTKLIKEQYNFIYQLTFIDTTILYSITKDELDNLIHINGYSSCFFNCIIDGIENTLERLGFHIANLQVQMAEERLYTFINGVAYLKDNGISEVNVTRKSLGKMVNVKRETCSRLLKNLEINGDIDEIDGSIIRIKKDKNHLYS